MTIEFIDCCGEPPVTKRAIMPIFEYACEKCQSEFELLVRGDDKPACPECVVTRFIGLARQRPKEPHEFSYYELPSPPPKTSVGLPADLPFCGLADLGAT